MDNTHAILARKAQIFGLLEAICQVLDLTDTQYKTATNRYKAVGTWLMGSDLPILKASSIYPQGSIRLGTSVKPINRDEFDVDLVCYFPGLTRDVGPAAVKKLVGDRLRQNGQYQPPVLEEKKRCWRINYANEFHLDITPSIRNPGCTQGGELVPDKDQRTWKATNPKGYSEWFDLKAAVLPRFRLAEVLSKYRADVEPMPAQTIQKGLLRRFVQLLKQDRDTYFTKNPDVAPISIIVTTLAAKAYEHCVQTQIYDSEIDLLLDVAKLMPAFIKTEEVMGVAKHYHIPNETTSGENFADKWNQDSRLPQAFFIWDRDTVRRQEKMLELGGLDLLGKQLEESYGSSVANRVLAQYTERISAARIAGRLTVAAGLGLSAASAGVSVRPNTFFGGEIQ